jgi:hypothetical protein
LVGAVGFIVQLGVTLFFLGLASLTAAWALLRHMSPRSATLLSALTAFLLTLLLFLVGSLDRPEGFWALLQAHFSGKGFEEHWKESIERLSGSGLFSADKLEPFKEDYRKYYYLGLPAWILLRNLVEGILAYFIASLVLSRITPKVEKPLPFRSWLLPEPLVFGLIGAAFLKIWAPAGAWTDILGTNLLVLFLGLYILAGLSIVAFFFHKWNVRVLGRVMGYLLIAVFGANAVLCLGVLDVWFDFRKIKKPAEPAPAA